MGKNSNQKIGIVAIFVILFLVVLFLRWILGLLSLALIIYMIYKMVRTKQKRWLWLFVPVILLISVAGSGQGNHARAHEKEATSQQKKETAKHKQKISQAKKVKASSVSAASSKGATTTDQTQVQKNQAAILQQMVTATNAKSAGDNGNYYYNNGPAELTGFEGMKPGQTKFTSDAQGRSSVARAVLTYDDYSASRGGRQGEPLDPPAWLDNSMVAINFGLTGRTYHGYLFNRSHSIADSLLGQKSYSSEYNFTTGTRSQNVGANKDGGMRAAEELAEGYWAEHPGTTNTIEYETTPLYSGN